MSREGPMGERPEPAVFRGPPDRLDALLPEALAPAEPGAVQPAVSLEGAEVRAMRVRSQRATLRLPVTTPPGRYEGSAEIEGRAVPIVVEVEPRPRLQAHPRRIELSVEPGATATVELLLLNAGNVPCEVARASTFCLFEGGGIEHAFWAALASDPREGRQRIDVLLDDLATSHGGMVDARVAKGGPIEPGASRTVQLTLRFTDRLRAGCRYAGAWGSDGLRVPVRVNVPARRGARAAKAT